VSTIVTLWHAVGYALYLYLIIVLARFVLEITHQFARKWRPAGVAAVGIELVFISTDPPIRLLRRLIPPLRLGPVHLDLSIVILLLVILGLYWVVLSLG
jgi:YggT family protein